MSCVWDKDMLPSLFDEQETTTVDANKTDYRSLVDCACIDTHLILLDMVGRVAMGIYTEVLIRKSCDSSCFQESSSI